MTRIAFVAFAAVLCATPALANAELSADEAKGAKAAASAWGCEGGKWEASGVFDLDDAKCKDGANYDLKFDKDFKLIAITKD